MLPAAGNTAAINGSEKCLCFSSYQSFYLV